MNRAFDHSDFREHVDAYLAGGLTGAERSALEAHAAACPSCAAALADATAQDASLRELFDATRPAADFEDRLVDRLRSTQAPYLFLHPMVRRAAGGVAAALMLGGFGYVASQAVQQGGLPTPWAMTVRSGNAPAASVNAGQALSRSKRETQIDLLVDGTSRRPETPADMANRFNASVSDVDSDATRWMYKERAGGEGKPESMRRGLSEWRERGREMSRLSAAAAAAAPVDTSGHAVPPPPEEVIQQKNQEAESEKGNKDAAIDQRDKGASVNLAYRYGFTAAGAGRMAGRGYGGGFGTSNPESDTKPGAAANKPASDSPNVNLYARPAVENGRTPDGAVTNRALLGDHLQATVDVKAGQSAEGVRLLAGTVVAGDAKASNAFRPNEYFVVPAPTAGVGIVSDIENGVARDAQPAPAPELLKQKQQAEGNEPKALGTLLLEQVAGEADAAPASTPAEPATQGTTGAPPTVPAAEPAAAGRKIIRNGEMSFEVDGFDSAYVQITKIAQEEGGFVATTDSEKLANGKVKGTVTIRVPPERLDTLVLKLRGLGDLKSSRLAAQDITKQYTDLESQLRASRAMEERLLNIIKTGKGEIKDLVEAEKQLGVYREKIEQVEGEIRYYGNLISLSTLNVTLIERDIRTAAVLSETEQVDMGVESQDVEKARADAIKAIEEAKGRIVESNLKKLEAGQFAAKVVADVPPDAAGALIDRMKQIGTVARLEVSRKQSAPEGTVAPTPARGAAGPRLERRDTRFLISLYNLANVAPRQTTNLNLAAEDVEAAYRTILDQVKGAGGRIVTSQLNRPRPDQTTGTITFEAPAEGADVLLGAVRAAGEVMRLDVSQNPDAQNVTEAKRGFAVQVFSIASVAPRETTSLRVAARGVNDAFNRLRETVRAAQGARILSSQLTEQDPANVTGTLDFEVRRADWAAVETALRDAGQVVSRNVARSADTENTVDTKVRLQVVLVDEAALQPRESVTAQLAVADVPGQYGKLLEALAASQARIIQSQLSEDESKNNVTGTLVFDVRRENHPAVERVLAEAGDVVSRSVVRSTDTQNTLDDKIRLSLTLVDAAKLAPRETTTLGMEAADVEKAKEQVESLALSLGGRVVDSTLSREQNGRVIAKVVADVPLGRSIEMVRRTRDQGRVQFRRDARDETVPQGTLARARVDVTLANEERIVESGQGLGATIREGLRTSVTGLLWSLQLIVVGLFLVAPWALIVYVCWRLMRKAKTRRQAVATAPAA